MKRCQKLTRVGFTLIELLVVIAIIAILAAILFPVFSHGVQSRLREGSSDNLHVQSKVNRAGLPAIHSGLRRSFPTSRLQHSDAFRDCSDQLAKPR